MGCTYSAQMLDIALVPLEQPVAAIDLRCCEPRVITLADDGLRDVRKCTLYDVDTRAVRFQTQHKPKLKIFLSSRQWLLDRDGVSIANFERANSLDTIAVHRGSEHDGDALCQIRVDLCVNDSTSVRVEFCDIVTGEPCTLGFQGHWYERDAILWLDRGRQGRRDPVAKIYRPTTSTTSSSRHGPFFQVDVAPNMDAALVALVCLTLAAAEQRRRSD